MNRQTHSPKMSNGIPARSARPSLGFPGFCNRQTPTRNRVEIKAKTASVRQLRANAPRIVSTPYKSFPGPGVNGTKAGCAGRQIEPAIEASQLVSECSVSAGVFNVRLRAGGPLLARTSTAIWLAPCSKYFDISSREVSFQLRG